MSLLPATHTPPPLAVLPTDIVFNREINLIDFRLFTLLSAHGNRRKENLVWLSVDKMAKFLSESRTRIYESLEKLQNLNLILDTGTTKYFGVKVWKILTQTIDVKQQTPLPVSIPKPPVSNFSEPVSKIDTQSEKLNREKTPTEQKQPRKTAKDEVVVVFPASKSSSSSIIDDVLKRVEALEKLQGLNGGAATPVSPSQKEEKIIEEVPSTNDSVSSFKDEESLSTDTKFSVGAIIQDVASRATIQETESPTAQDSPSEMDKVSVSFPDDFPKTLIKPIRSLLRKVPEDQQQALIDEYSYRIKNSTIKNYVSYFAKLVKLALDDIFVPSIHTLPEDTQRNEMLEKIEYWKNKKYDYELHQTPEWIALEEEITEFYKQSKNPRWEMWRSFV